MPKAVFAWDLEFLPSRGNFRQWQSRRSEIKRRVWKRNAGCGVCWKQKPQFCSSGSKHAKAPWHVCHFSASNAFSIPPGDWRRSELTCPSLALIQMGIHLVDVMRTVLGDVVSVSAHFQNLMVQMPNPDLSAIILEFDSGASGVMINSYIHNDCYTVWHGSEGVLRYLSWPDEGRIERLDKLGHVDEADHWIDFDPVDSLACELRDYQLAVRDDRPPTVDGEEALKSLLPVVAAVESARSGRRVQIQELL